jgi:transcriptional repressor NrdR
VAKVNLHVVKRDGRREEFDREKVLAGIRKACAKRPISIETMEEIVNEIEVELYKLGKPEVESRVIGEMVMERLRELDDVAYVRFASVYRRFVDVESLAEEIERIREWKRRATPVRLMVIKESGRREEFERRKIFNGIIKACAKRPIPIETIERIASEIEAKLYNLGRPEVESRVIGEMVMERLRELDDVAYMRFVSVYRRFADVESLADEIEKLLEEKRREEELKAQ